MHLFGAKHKRDHDHTIMDNTGGGRHNNTMGLGPGAHTTTGANQPFPEQGYGGQTGQPGFGQGAYAHSQPTVGTVPGGHGLHNDDLHTTGAHTATHTGAHGTAIPPTGAVSHDKSAPGAGQRLVGKFESAVGALVGSSGHKSKGLQKEQDANSVKMQGRELAEAERLEREAMMHRERAVAHGAHPANAALGTGHPGTGQDGPGVYT